MYQLAVIGNPIAHSLSPVVFNIFAQQCGVKLQYDRILAQDITNFNQLVEQFFAQGGTALNITSPFKQEAYRLASEHTPRASFCQTSNFLTVNAKQQIVADTTDGIGLVQDLVVNNRLGLTNKKILIIGSGFVLDSILLDLIVHNPRHIDILARNQARIEQLQHKFAIGCFMKDRQYELILNTTPNIKENSLFNQITQLAADAWCYDLTYSNQLTLFLATMQQLNPHLSCRNGLGMLVEQARVAFTKLFGQAPDTIAALTILARMGYHA
jgi:shikimate dehydrogenase